MSCYSKDMYLFAVKPYTSQADVQAILDTLEEGECLLALPYSRMGEFAPGIRKGVLDIPSVDPKAFTSPIAARLPKAVNATFAIVHEPKKVPLLWEQEIEPFICIGESLEDVEKENSAETITRQITAALGEAPSHPFSVIYTAPWFDELQHLPEENELQHRFDFCRELIHSLYPSKPLVYCYAPTWAPQLQSEGYYIRF